MINPVASPKRKGERTRAEPKPEDQAEAAAHQGQVAAAPEAHSQEVEEDLIRRAENDSGRGEFTPPGRCRFRPGYLPKTSVPLCVTRQLQIPYSPVANAAPPD